MSSRYVIICLTENANGTTPRTITLDENRDSCLLGRASRKGTDIVAQPDNGYFENPVVSRNHAEIRADFTYDRVYIKDIGSTHGTFVNNMRIPATVRHPIRTDDVVTLGIEIKSQGPAFEPVVYPPLMKVGVRFGTNPAAGSNAFRVPDETSVEGSEPEDTLGRARRFIHEHGNRSIYNTIDLTQETIPFNLTGGVDIPVSSEQEDEDMELPALGGAEAEDVPEVYTNYDENYSRDYAEDDGDSEGFSEGEIEEDLKDEDDVGEGAAFNLSDDDEIEEEGYDSPCEPACTRTIGDIEPSASGALVDESIIVDQVEATVTEERTSANVEVDSEDGGDLSQPEDEVPSFVESTSEEVASVVPISPEINRHDKPTSTEDSINSKKRKASEISRDEEPNTLDNKDKTTPTVDVLPASGVQTDPSEEREPKRRRSTAEVLGYTALGGVAGALAVFTTLVVSAPSYS